MYNTNIKAILFDMDGVVIDSEKLYSSSEKRLLAKYGVKFDSNDWNYIKGCTESQFYDLIYKKFDIPVPRNQLIKEGRSYLMDVFSEKLNYMNGFKSLYSKINQQYKLALVTSTGPVLVNHIDSLLNIKSKFNVVITSDDTKLHKPHGAPYRKAMNLLGVKEEECMVVEDSLQGIKSGKSAGAIVVALEGSIEKKYLKDADYIISNLTHIQNIL